MKLKKWALIAEIVGGIAIVISLIYVGYEISQNTSELRASNRQSIAERVEDFAIAAASNPELAAVMGREVDPASLTPVQQQQLTMYNVAFYRSAEEAYLQFLDGSLSDEYWNTRAVVTVSRTKGKSGGPYWARDKGNFSPRFAAWLDGELERE